MLNLKGSTFGRLTVVEKTALRQGKSIIWKCICRCGNQNALVPARDLVATRKGCGVCHDTKHPLYSIYRGIITRCEDKTSLNYINYGGRGIKICARWREDFLNFVEDLNKIGSRPSDDYSLDRIDNNGNYEPSNVRWADAYTQANNRRPITVGLTKENIVEIYTSKLEAKNFAEKFNITEKTVYNIRSMSYSEFASQAVAEFLLNKAP